jgi:NAD(P)-dependent dehydrogenase (short-subunit alcohol dehydrogenase family)
MTEAQGGPVEGCLVVLGATGGIGSALVRSLAAKGDRLLLAGRDAVKLEALAAETGADWLVLDARRAADVQAALEGAVERFGRVDGIANCVGSLLLKPAHLTTQDEFDATVATNLGSAFATVHAAGRVMRRGGSIVLVSSAAARLGLPNHEAIAAAKAGIIGLALSAAATYASRGLRVNCVAPGLVETSLTAGITGNAQAAKASVGMHALGRLGAPEDVASAIGWFLAPEQSWVTGQVLGVDGGLGSVRARSTTS